MSFILDAIAKSEQERQQQLAPDAGRLAFPVATPARKRRIPWYLLAGVLLLNAILITIWLQSNRTQITPLIESSGTGASTSPAPADQPQTPVEFHDVPNPTAPTDTPEPISQSSQLAKPSISESSDEKAPKTVVEGASSAEIELRLARTTDEPAPASTAIGQMDENGARESLQTSLEPDPGEVSIETMAKVPEMSRLPPSATESRERISRLSDLPADVRREFPSMEFTGHLYSSNPLARYVLIGNGRRIVAGQQIKGDLILDEITPTGVVVEFQGYLIEFGLLQNWSLK